MRKITRPITTGYYLIPKTSNRRLYGVKPLHCFYCGNVKDSELLYIIWVDVGDADGDCNRQESFDFPIADCERLRKNATYKEKEKEKEKDNNTSELIDKQKENSSEGYVGATFAEVISDNPKWLVKIITTDKKGKDIISANIKEPKFRGN